MDQTTAQIWLDAYVQAWLTYDPVLIGDLFSEDVHYKFHPSDAPIVGRDAVVRAWLGEADDPHASTRDAPGTYEASYVPVAIDGDIVVAVGTSSYRDAPGGPVTRVYDNCFLLVFDAEARCQLFTEYYVRRPDAPVA